jgi:hypothetical protein
MRIRSLLLSCIAALTMAGSFASLTTPVQAGTKFWVYNNTGYAIYHVYADRDSSGGQRDLLGPRGVIPPYDQALTIRPRGNNCWSNVAVVNQYNQWVWFQNVNICSSAGVAVNPWDFD